MANILEQHGAQPQHQPKYVPIFIDRAFTGLYTQRSFLHDPSDLATARFYGGRPDALWQGSNVELTNRLTLQRRPGLTAFSSATYPTVVDRTFAFQLNNGTIQVIVDTGSTGSLVLSAVAASVGTTAVYTGTFPGGGSNAYVGMVFTIAGFANGPNNGSFLCTASTTTTITLANANAVAETLAATAISSGAIYVDNQDGTKTLLFGKAAGAGQAYFVGVAGVLYIGDGVEVKKYTPGNPNGTIWNWGGNAPTTAPTLTVTETGAAAVAWAASTWFSTMGIIIDSNTFAWQLIGVNNAGSQIGTSGSGQPPWSATLTGTTTDNTITWENAGTVQNWAPHKGFAGTNNIGQFGYSHYCYDVVSGCIFFATTTGTTGATRPNFSTVVGSGTNNDGTVNWLCMGSFAQLSAANNWQPSHAYSFAQTVFEPFIPPSGPGQSLSSQPMYGQFVSVAGTSGTFSTPFGGSGQPAGNQQVDGQLLWVSLGSATWASGTTYTAWTSSANSNFSCIKDSNGNLQICTKGGVSAGLAPTFTQSYGSSVSESTGVQWTCVGSAKAATWVAGQKYYLPKTGFAAPTPADPYGGASVIDSNGDVEFVVNTGLSGFSQPVWNGIGQYTPDPNPNFVLTQVAVGGGNATYTGTITGGGANAFAGDVFLISGFVNGGNNILITVTASTATTLVCVLTTQVNETHAAVASQGNLIWYNLEANPANSQSWTKGHNWAYSFKARSLTDFYSTAVNGVLPIPPGLTTPLPPPTGSETGLITTASPVATVTGSNPGAVVTVSGLGSTDTQFDTIVIWRDADGGGASNMFELTEIPMPPPINGVAQPWSFLDFLPDTPTADFPGLNTLIPAPIDDSNDPPNKAFLPMVFNYQRIWGALGETVPFSGGPDVVTGNPNEAFAPADELPFLAPVTRVVRNSQGLIVFLTDSVEAILGGPATSTFFSTTLAPGIGLVSFNALDVFGGEIFFFASDNSFRVINPALNLSLIGFPLGDQFANTPSSGVSDATWSPANVYVAVHQNGTDNCIFVADGSTGWYRVNPNQVPGASSGPEPIWSPFATITAGCKMVQSLETSPGTKTLLVGSTTAGSSISKRALGTYTDNGSTYDAYFIMGAIVLAHPGQIALLKFLELDLSGVKYKPTVSYLLNELSGTYAPFVSAPVFDPPSLYGNTTNPLTYSPNRYYFTGEARLARCRFLSVKVDFGSTSNGDEVFDMTIFGRMFAEF